MWPFGQQENEKRESDYYISCFHCIHWEKRTDCLKDSLYKNLARVCCKCGQVMGT